MPMVLDENMEPCLSTSIYNCHDCIMNVGLESVSCKEEVKTRGAAAAVGLCVNRFVDWMHCSCTVETAIEL